MDISILRISSSTVFDCVVVEHQEMGPESFHIEVQIGDSVVVLETGKPLPKDFTTGPIYVYVPNVDASYRRALRKVRLQSLLLRTNLIRSVQPR